MLLKEGINLYNVGAYEEALKFFDDYVKIGARGKVIIFYYKGMCYYKLGYFRDSLEHFLKYLNFNKCRIDLYIPLCVSIYKCNIGKGRVVGLSESKIEYWFKTTISLFPKNASLYYMFIEVFRSTGCAISGLFIVRNIKRFNFLSLINKAISLDKFNYKYYKVRGEIYFCLREYDKSLKDLLFIFDYYKDDDEIIYEISYCYANKNNPNFLLAQKFYSNNSYSNNNFVRLYNFNIGGYKFVGYTNEKRTLKNKIFGKNVSKW